MRLWPALACLVVQSAAAQILVGPQPRVAVDHDTRTATLEKLADVLESDYVLPDVAVRLASEMRRAAAQDRYSAAEFSGQFAQRVTADLMQISGDRHLRFVQSSPGGPPTGPGDAIVDQAARRGNFGFEQVRRLPGNIGYLDLREFMSRDEAYQVAAAAMRFLAASDALIVDLRENSGGGPGMVAFLGAYFFSEKTLLNTHYNRKLDETTELWTRDSVSGPGFSDKPLYLLTSSRTFSAGEDFAYALQARKRATLVGETTAGGAHLTTTVRLHEHFVVFVPQARAVNSVTHDNWEGRGVQPDIEARAQDALETAHALALEQLLPDSPAPRMLRDALEQARANLEAARARPAEAAERRPGLVIER